MRTWVRRVRLWLGVLLLAVGVVASALAQFAYSHWSVSYLLLDAGQFARTDDAPVAFKSWVCVGSVERWHVRCWFEWNVDGSAYDRAEVDRMRAEDKIPWSGGGMWEMRPIAGFFERFWPWQGPEGRDWGTKFENWNDWRVAGLSLHYRERPSSFSGRPNLVVSIPFYLPLLLGLTLRYSPLRAVIVKRRRGRRGACLACGYDRRSLAADQPCPECGKA